MTEWEDGSIYDYKCANVHVWIEGEGEGGREGGRERGGESEGGQREEEREYTSYPQAYRLATHTRSKETETDSSEDMSSHVTGR